MSQLVRSNLNRSTDADKLFFISGGDDGKVFDELPEQGFCLYLRLPKDFEGCGSAPPSNFKAKFVSVAATKTS
ncbi:hypothetical protein V6N13_052400 [Hibiscus sabdariffa]|uniref:Uncharacterized protein n=1 Tax=Hibiscus sabdariffa TaxID=183260 RepID=A0ABR2Q4W0_9ROSI